jgi:hypothetical protein
MPAISLRIERHLALAVLWKLTLHQWKCYHLTRCLHWGLVFGPVRRIVLRSCPVRQAISLIDKPPRYMSLIMKRSSTSSMSGDLLCSPVDYTTLHRLVYACQGGDSILAPLGTLHTLLTVVLPRPAPAHDLKLTGSTENGDTMHMQA